MRFSPVLLVCAFAIAPFQSTIATPFYRTNCLPNGVCVDYTKNQIISLDARQLPSLGGIISGLPIIGPILGPILGPLLGAIGLSDIDVTSQVAPSIDEEQFGVLTALESVLLDAVHQIMSQNNATSSSKVTSLHTQGLPLASILTSLPAVGPFLQPLDALLSSIDLSSVDATPGTIYSMSLNDNQKSTLSQLQTILTKEVPAITPTDDNDTPTTPTPSNEDSNTDPTTTAADPTSDAATPSATPAPARTEGDEEDSDSDASDPVPSSSA